MILHFYMNGISLTFFSIPHIHNQITEADVESVVIDYLIIFHECVSQKHMVLILITINS